MKHYSTVETFILFTLHMKVSTVLLLNSGQRQSGTRCVN